MLTPDMQELEQQGLIDHLFEPHLTEKGRVWLHTLEEVETDEIVYVGESAAELVLATSALVR